MLNVVSSMTNEVTPSIYRGESCMDKFCKTIIEIREDIFTHMKTLKPSILTHEPEQEFQICVYLWWFI